MDMDQHQQSNLFISTLCLLIFIFSNKQTSYIYGAYYFGMIGRVALHVFVFYTHLNADT